MSHTITLKISQKQSHHMLISHQFKKKIYFYLDEAAPHIYVPT